MIGQADMNKYFLIILAALLFFWVNPTSTQAALLYSQAANQVIGLDQTFIVDWYLDTQGQIINSVDLKLSYSKETLEAVQAEAGLSGLNLWIKTPTFDNEKGMIELIGGAAGGFKTNKFPVFRTTFIGKTLGAAKITLNDSSEVLLSDGSGTRMKLSFAELNFPVVPAAAAERLINSPTHPDETVWYKANNVTINVRPKEGSVYSYSFSSNAEIFPDELVDDVASEIKFENLPDGLYHFKLNSKTGGANWEEAGVYRVMIDRTSPDSFTPVVTSDPSVFDGKLFVSFATTDKVSGISQYAVKVGVLGAWTEIEGTYYVLPTIRLSDQIQVKAIDSAGNEQIASAVVAKGNVNFAKWLIWIIIIGSLIGLVWFIRKTHQHLKIPKV